MQMARPGLSLILSGNSMINYLPLQITEAEKQVASAKFYLSE